MRREVAFYLATHMDQHQNDLIPLIRGIYGAGDPNTFPQSVCSYLQEISPSQSLELSQGPKLGSDMTGTWPM